MFDSVVVVCQVNIAAKLGLAPYRYCRCIYICSGFGIGEIRLPFSVFLVFGRQIAVAVPQIGYNFTRLFRGIFYVVHPFVSIVFIIPFRNVGYFNSAAELINRGDFISENQVSFL